jgi:type VI secretion system VasD/TssJ family lipoprotein
MRRDKTLVSVVLLMALGASCASITGGPDWRYERDAIRLHMKADPNLNYYERKPHTLLVCVYQLRDPNALNQLMENREGVSQLLECERFDPSVTFSKRIVLQPGREVTETMDRSEGAKYVAVAGGYYTLQKDRTIRLYPIPVSSLTRKPQRLDIDLTFGPQEIRETRGK